MNGVDGQIACLQGIDEGQPDQITKGEHETETIGGDVHGRQDGGFHVESIEDVQCLEGSDQQDTVTDGVVELVLLRDEGHVQDDPAEHARSEFAEGFDVQGANQGEIDSRVQLTANEPIVDDVA